MNSRLEAAATNYRAFSVLCQWAHRIPEEYRNKEEQVSDDDS
jgi:hypothetical protein